MTTPQLWLAHAVETVADAATEGNLPDLEVPPPSVEQRGDAEAKLEPQADLTEDERHNFALAKDGAKVNPPTIYKFGGLLF